MYFSYINQLCYIGAVCGCWALWGPRNTCTWMQSEGQQGVSHLWDSSWTPFPEHLWECPEVPRSSSYGNCMIVDPLCMVVGWKAKQTPWSALACSVSFCLHAHIKAWSQQKSLRWFYLFCVTKMNPSPHTILIWAHCLLIVKSSMLTCVNMWNLVLLPQNSNQLSQQYTQLLGLVHDDEVVSYYSKFSLSSQYN